MILGEVNLAGADSPISKNEEFSKEEIPLVIEEINEKFSEIQKKIILANFSDENKPNEEIVNQVINLIKILSELAEKPELQEVYFNLANKYTFLAKFVKELTDKEVPSFPV